jgi:hypothetical protein
MSIDRRTLPLVETSANLRHLFLNFPSMDATAQDTVRNASRPEGCECGDPNEADGPASCICLPLRKLTVAFSIYY